MILIIQRFFLMIRFLFKNDQKITESIAFPGTEELQTSINQEFLIFIFFRENIGKTRKIKKNKFERISPSISLYLMLRNKICGKGTLAPIQMEGVKKY